MPDGARRHRFEAQGIAVSVRAHCGLAEGQEPRGAGSPPASGRNLGTLMAAASNDGSYSSDHAKSNCEHRSRYNETRNAGPHHANPAIAEPGKVPHTVRSGYP